MRFRLYVVDCIREIFPFKFNDLAGTVQVRWVFGESAGASRDEWWKTVRWRKNGLMLNWFEGIGLTLNYLEKMV